ncbi:MAG: hrb [Actinomycetia bacterium]|nr:hrb [Actinomycetes bacterium]
MMGDVEEEQRPFHAIVANIDYSMMIVTVSDGRERAGCLVGFGAQCSIDPARFFVCISKRNHTARVAEHAPVFGIHFPRVGDMALARLFGEATGDEIDKFEHCTWSEGPEGVPVLDGLDWFPGEVMQHVDSGDHVGYLVDVLDGGSSEHAHEPALTFQMVHDFHPGHEA